MDHKTLPFVLDESHGGGTKASKGRRFAGWASTVDLDLVQDIVDPQAFASSLREWKAGRRRIPLLNQHRYHRIEDVVGKLVKAEITDTGLWTEFEVIDSPSGQEALARVRGGFIDGLSIGFRGAAGQPVEINGRTVRRIYDLDLHEVSLVIWPANEAARIPAGSSPPKSGASHLQTTDAGRQDLERRLLLMRLRAAESGEAAGVGGSGTNTAERKAAAVAAASGWDPGDPRRDAMERRFRELRIRAAVSRIDQLV